MKIETQCSRILRPWREKVAAGRMRGYKNCHAELVSASQHCFPRPLRERMPGGQVRGYSLGFTLIEILVVVLIIGILGAIALPQYQRALLKSRYAALMPIAKSMANSNEAYYLEHGIYADDPQDLLIQGQSRYTDDTELEFGTVSDYAYVLAKNEDKIPNNTFIVYQKHSGEFPGEIHCEALADNDLAESVCKSFGGNESIGKTLTDGYETYVLFGTGDGVAPSGDNGGNDEPEEPETPTCEGAAPTKQEACSSGCGSVTVTAECEEGEWVYPTADMSSCPVKPNDETVECGTGFTGNKTRTATCNSAGTAWEFTDNWNTSGCTAVPTCSGSQPANITASNSGATGTAYCDEQSGEWVYTWTGGKTFSGKNSECSGNSTYACAGAIFTGLYSSCSGYKPNGCTGAIFSGPSSACIASARLSCAEAEIQAGAYCLPGASNSCDGAKYGAHPDKDSKLFGSCDNEYGYCSDGVPLLGSWNATTQSYNIKEWKGGYCDAKVMVSGVCPIGSPTGSDTTTTDKTTAAGWYGGYCDPVVSGKCPAGSPKQGGGCWDGNGNQTTCS